MTIISGNHEYRALGLRGHDLYSETGTQVETHAQFNQYVQDSISRISNTEVGSVVEACAFIATCDDLGQVKIDYIQMQPTAADLNQYHVAKDTLGWMLPGDKAIALYNQFCYQCEIIIDDEEQRPDLNTFCFGDINNNFYIEQV